MFVAQLICPSKREVMVFGSFKQTGTLLPKAPKGWGWRRALLFDEQPEEHSVLPPLCSLFDAISLSANFLFWCPSKGFAIIFSYVVNSIKLICK